MTPTRRAAWRLQPRLAVDAAIERWLRALARASGMRSTSALLAQVQEYGCCLHGGGRGDGPQLCGLVDADRIVCECTPDELGVLLLRYWCVVSEPVDHDATGQVVHSAARYRSDDEVAALLGVAVSSVERLLTSARQKVARAMRGG